MTKPVWSHVLALTVKIAHRVSLPGNLSPDYNDLHVSQISHTLSFYSKTIADCIRYIIGVFCYNFKSQMNIFASY